jgi:hypothetical protein
VHGVVAGAAEQRVLSPSLPRTRSSPPLPASESFEGNPSIVLLLASPMKVKKKAMSRPSWL